MASASAASDASDAKFRAFRAFRKETRPEASVMGAFKNGQSGQSGQSGRLDQVRASEAELAKLNGICRTNCTHCPGRQDSAKHSFALNIEHGAGCSIAARRKAFADADQGPTATPTGFLNAYPRLDKNALDLPTERYRTNALRLRVCA